MGLVGTPGFGQHDLESSGLQRRHVFRHKLHYLLSAEEKIPVTEVVIIIGNHNGHRTHIGLHHRAAFEQRRMYFA